MLSNYWTWRGHGKPGIVSRSVGSMSGLGAPWTCGWHSKWSQSCESLWGGCDNSWGLVPKLNYSTPVKRKEDLNKWKDILFSRTGRLNIVKMSVLPNWYKVLTPFLSKSHQDYFVDIDKITLKFRKRRIKW